MKKILALIITAFVTLSCNPTKFSATGDKEKKFVSDFLECMDHGSSPKYEEMMDAISPKYIKEKSINKATYKVDNYTIWGYSIETYNNNGLITAKVWGEDRKWVHLLTFKLSHEGGKLYLIPSEHSDSYISPWWERQTYIKERNN
jgi:hypothetical protein